MKHLEPIFRWRASWMCWHKVWRTYGRWKHWIVLPPSHHLGLLPGGCCPVALIWNIVWRYVTLMEELGSIPLPSHSWMALLVEDMLHNARTGLTKAVVTGPGRAVLFYGRCSMGEGLTADRARNATFLFTGAGTWVGKSAYLATDSMTIQEGKRAIAQAVSDHQVKARGPRHPRVNQPVQQPFWFNPLGVPLQKMHLEIAVLTTHHHPISPQGAGNVICIGGTKGLDHLGSLHLPQTMVLRVTGVCYQQCPWCRPDLTGQMGQGIPDEVDDIEKPTWR